MNELRQTVAMLFSHKGRPSMTERDFILMASMHFRWFPPKDAQKLLDLAVEMNLVTRKEGEISPNFDLKSVEIPLDFSPGPEILRTKPKETDLFTQILEKTSKESQTDQRELISKINSTQSDMDITIEVAAIIVGRELGVDLSSFYRAVEEGL
ncbi:MAG: DUF2240 family protein [Thermoplasmata archaeon]